MNTLARALLALFFAGLFYSKLLAQSPGDTMGWTQYTYQSNGSIGRLITLDNLGGVHFVWMAGEPYPSIRNIKYNCFTAGSPSPWPGQGTTISYRNLAGYPQIGTLSDGNAICTWHHAGSGAESLVVSADQFQCLGAFGSFGHPPNRLGVNKMLWPHIDVDRYNRVHIVAMYCSPLIKCFDM